mmetsp:Transcript_26240/g.19709  ORF Transcript_26240/g.19709 Transcript_26240/m.19709 type:complete len:86 (-) Transcript_26240:71-328(-)
MRASRLNFKNFCALNSKSKKTFFEIHSFALKVLFKLWHRESNKKGEDEPAFFLIMQETKEFVTRLLSKKYEFLEDMELEASRMIE